MQLVPYSSYAEEAEVDAGAEVTAETAAEEAAITEDDDDDAEALLNNGPREESDKYVEEATIHMYGSVSNYPSNKMCKSSSHDLNREFRRVATRSWTRDSQS